MKWLVVFVNGKGKVSDKVVSASDSLEAMLKVKSSHIIDVQLLSK